MRDPIKLRFKFLHGPSGFTMPEVLAVIVISSILVSIAIPNYLSIINKAKCSLDSVSSTGYNEVLITTPSNNDSIPINSTFYGTFNAISSDWTSWVYIYAPGIKKYYLERIRELDKPSRKVNEQGDWSLDNIVIGGALDSQANYIAGILMTRGNSTKTLEKKEDELDKLPCGKKLSEIQITRQ
jgi:prepilin-type N-terminal cleavage/methylation domain-containing protein